MTVAAPIPLFGRKVRVVVSTLEITGLRCQFKVKRDLKPKPNTADLKVWNLSESHRAALEQMGDVPALIEAGYEAGSSVLFVGSLNNVFSVIEGPDIVTTFGCLDGKVAIQKARVNIPIRKGTPTDAVLKQLARAIGVGEGNLAKAVTQLKAAGFGTLFPRGTVLSGSASRELTSICRACGMTWSIQDSKLQILPLAQALDSTAIKLSSTTGMVGSPTVDNKGVMKVKMLMAPDVFPGRKIVLDAARLKGQYRIESSEHSGDTHEGDWYIDVEGKRY